MSASLANFHQYLSFRQSFNETGSKWTNFALPFWAKKQQTSFAFGEGLPSHFFYISLCGQEESVLHLGLGVRMFRDNRFHPQGFLAVWTESHRFLSQERMVPFLVLSLLLLVFLWLPLTTSSVSQLCSQQYLDLMGLGTCLFFSLVCYKSSLWRPLPWTLLTQPHSMGRSLQPFVSLICSEAAQISKLTFRKESGIGFPQGGLRFVIFLRRDENIVLLLPRLFWTPDSPKGKKERDSMNVSNKHFYCFGKKKKNSLIK